MANSEFEKNWRDKISEAVKGMRKNVEVLFPEDDREDLVFWSKNFMKGLKDKFTPDEIREIMCSASCHYPEGSLADLHELYVNTGDLKLVHKTFESNFKREIKEYKNLTDEQVDMIIEKGWGAAGILEGNTIVATKIPKEFHKYFEACTSEERNYFYCHCPRIREMLLKNESIDIEYCYCGAGFYKDIWEKITGKKVEVKVLKSIMNDDETCSIEISILED
ncbi:hypothetical protein SAMN02745751_01363 [Dethiosulfatibacter aminovorans DSM 17477]|uniref:Uncharacterized protein n=1 Tax=Dethiosulfatibacter aminovorans DSM 17477 TaxID=1121476 RepID=A0A1M6F5R4_9FIRM|nr:DUF6144 family protein [Dethiosulfatibacter aminovorans]SHI93045.1 hypothetical protein SAMN02745751_01363 [Dethiosulfatibacter aminovorans DSM 17477]